MVISDEVIFPISFAIDFCFYLRAFHPSGRKTREKDMLQQVEITQFFSPARRRMSGESGAGGRKRISVRSMSQVCKTPAKASNNQVKVEPADVILILSSDEENGAAISPEGSGRGNLKDSKVNISPTTRCRRSNGEPNGLVTPKKESPPGTRLGRTMSPYVSTFYSPSKRRSVKKLSPVNRLSLPITPKKLFAEGEELLKEACMGQDDKTKFLLQAIYNVLSEEEVCRLLSEQGKVLLRQYLRMRGPGVRLICRLYWHQQRWYRWRQLNNICDTGKDQKTSESAMYQLCVDNGLLIAGTLENTEFDDYVKDLLQQDEVRKICKNLLKLRSQTKQDAVEQLRAYCRSSNPISKYFKVQNNNGSSNNETRVLKLLHECSGNRYKFSEEFRSVIDRVHVLAYLGLDPEILRSKQLEFLLLNVKSNREVFPSPPAKEIDNAGSVFRNQAEFENYMIAHEIYERFQKCTETNEKVATIKHAFNMFREVEIELFRSLPSWLRRFTPPYLYLKLMEEGLVTLKQTGDRVLCNLAVDMLGAMLHQNLFRQHRRARWYDEKALILHIHLQQPDQAAAALLEAFDSLLTQEERDVIAPRASRLAQQKNIHLERSIRQLLLTHATKHLVAESAMPAVHFYKQAMENTAKSNKIVFETVFEDGSREMSSVEQYAITCYKDTGEYTHGCHWEGRFITTVFFLLFWDVIYSKPNGARGIFLCPYQRYPLDLFTEDFCENRKAAIEERLKCIGSSSMDDVVRLMSVVWCARPENEHSGIERSLGWERVCGAVRCLGVAGLTAICRRLASQYHLAHSGFPDLTLWHPDDKKIKFAEVKSDKDKASTKQIQWIKFLLLHNVPAELCYVGTRKPK